MSQKRSKTGVVFCQSGRGPNFFARALRAILLQNPPINPASATELHSCICITHGVPLATASTLSRNSNVFVLVVSVVSRLQCYLINLVLGFAIRGTVTSEVTLVASNIFSLSGVVEPSHTCHSVGLTMAALKYQITSSIGCTCN